MDRKIIASLVADELKKQTDEVLNIEDIKRMFNVKTSQGVRHLISAGLPAHNKKGIGNYFFKSEILNFLKSNG